MALDYLSLNNSYAEGDSRVQYQAELLKFQNDHSVRCKPLRSGSRHAGYCIVINPNADDPFVSFNVEDYPALCSTVIMHDYTGPRTSFRSFAIALTIVYYMLKLGTYTNLMIADWTRGSMSLNLQKLEIDPTLKWLNGRTHNNINFYLLDHVLIAKHVTRFQNTIFATKLPTESTAT